MAKLIPLYDELIFLDVIPELHSDFIERIKNKRKNKKQWLHHTLSPSIPSSVLSSSPASLQVMLSHAKSFPIQNLKIAGTPMNKAKSTKYTESQRNHGLKGRAPPWQRGGACVYGDFGGFGRKLESGAFSVLFRIFGGLFPHSFPICFPILLILKN